MIRLAGSRLMRRSSDALYSAALRWAGAGTLPQLICSAAHAGDDAVLAAAADAVTVGSSPAAFGPSAGAQQERHASRSHLGHQGQASHIADGCGGANGLRRSDALEPSVGNMTQVRVRVLSAADAYSPVLEAARSGGRCAGCGEVLPLQGGPYREGLARMRGQLQQLAGNEVLVQPELVLVVGPALTLAGYPPFQRRLASSGNLRDFAHRARGAALPEQDSSGLATSAPVAAPPGAPLAVPQLSQPQGRRSSTGVASLQQHYGPSYSQAGMGQPPQPPQPGARTSPAQSQYGGAAGLQAAGHVGHVGQPGGPVPAGQAAAIPHIGHMLARKGSGRSLRGTLSAASGGSNAVSRTGSAGSAGGISGVSAATRVSSSLLPGSQGVKTPAYSILGTAAASGMGGAGAGGALASLGGLSPQGPGMHGQGQYSPLASSSVVNSRTASAISGAPGASMRGPSLLRQGSGITRGPVAMSGGGGGGGLSGSASLPLPTPFSGAGGPPSAAASGALSGAVTGVRMLAGLSGVLGTGHASTSSAAAGGGGGGGGTVTRQPSSERGSAGSYGHGFQRASHAGHPVGAAGSGSLAKLVLLGCAGPSAHAAHSNAGGATGSPGLVVGGGMGRCAEDGDDARTMSGASGAGTGGGEGGGGSDVDDGRSSHERGGGGWFAACFACFKSPSARTMTTDYHEVGQPGRRKSRSLSRRLSHALSDTLMVRSSTRLGALLRSSSSRNTSQSSSAVKAGGPAVAHGAASVASGAGGGGSGTGAASILGRYSRGSSSRKLMLALQPQKPILKNSSGGGARRSAVAQQGAGALASGGVLVATDASSAAASSGHPASGYPASAYPASASGYPATGGFSADVTDSGAASSARAFAAALPPGGNAGSTAGSVTDDLDNPAAGRFLHEIPQGSEFAAASSGATAAVAAGTAAGAFARSRSSLGAGSGTRGAPDAATVSGPEPSGALIAGGPAAMPSPRSSARINSLPRGGNGAAGTPAPIGGGWFGEPPPGDASDAGTGAGDMGVGGSAAPTRRTAPRQAASLSDLPFAGADLLPGDDTLPAGVHSAEGRGVTVSAAALQPVAVTAAAPASVSSQLARAGSSHAHSSGGAASVGGSGSAVPGLSLVHRLTRQVSRSVLNSPMQLPSPSGRLARSSLGLSLGVLATHAAAPVTDSLSPLSIGQDSPRGLAAAAATPSPRGGGASQRRSRFESDLALPAVSDMGMAPHSAGPGGLSGGSRWGFEPPQEAPGDAGGDGGGNKGSKVWGDRRRATLVHINYLPHGDPADDADDESGPLRPRGAAGAEQAVPKGDFRRVWDRQVATVAAAATSDAVAQTGAGQLPTTVPAEWQDSAGGAVPSAVPVPTQQAVMVVPAAPPKPELGLNGGQDGNELTSPGGASSGAFGCMPPLPTRMATQTGALHAGVNALGSSGEAALSPQGHRRSISGTGQQAALQPSPQSRPLPQPRGLAVPAGVAAGAGLDAAVLVQHPQPRPLQHEVRHSGVVLPGVTLETLQAEAEAARSTHVAASRSNLLAQSLPTLTPGAGLGHALVGASRLSRPAATASNSAIALEGAHEVEQVRAPGRCAYEGHRYTSPWSYMTGQLTTAKRKAMGLGADDAGEGRGLAWRSCGGSNRAAGSGVMGALLRLLLPLLALWGAGRPAAASDLTGTAFPFENCKQDQRNSPYYATLYSYRENPEKQTSTVCIQIRTLDVCLPGKWRCCNTSINKVKFFPALGCRGSVASALINGNSIMSYYWEEHQGLDILKITPLAQWLSSPAKSDGAIVCLNLRAPCWTVQSFSYNAALMEYALYDKKILVFQDSAYLIFYTPTDWNSGQSTCQGLGGNLAAIDSQDEYNLLADAMLEDLAPEGFINLWFGLTVTTAGGAAIPGFNADGSRMSYMPINFQYDRTRAAVRYYYMTCDAMTRVCSWNYSPGGAGDIQSGYICEFMTAALTG
eukprot:XP_001691779.1 predicted protein [Chlamydomonas reinhardtii]